MKFKEIFKRKICKLICGIFTFLITINDEWIVKIINILNFNLSNSEIMRIINQGGMKINYKKIEDKNTRLEKGNYLIQIGKKKHFKLKIS